VISALLLILTTLMITCVTPAFSTLPPTPVYVVAVGGFSIYYGSDLAGAWQGWHKLPGQSRDAPAAALCNNILHIVVRGMVTQIYYGYVTLLNGTFFGWKQLAGSSINTASLSAVYSSTSPNCRLFLAVRGADNGIYWTTNSLPAGETLLNTFAPWKKVPGGKTIDTPALVATTTSAVLNELFLAVLGMDNHLWFAQYYFYNSTWSSWTKLTGASSYGPALATQTSVGVTTQPVYMSVVGLLGGVIWYRTWGGSSWGAWTSIPTGATPFTPSISLNFNSWLFVAVRGTGYGGTMYSCHLAGSTWSSWSSIPGATPSRPAITSEVNPFIA
jgi:hypothetical protein